MSRTHKDQIQQSHERHPDAPWWRYRLWLKHGPKSIRRMHNKLRRLKAKEALRDGHEPPRERRYLSWIWW